ncbi:MAG: ABC transporter permease [Actinobacteria bacterium]|nr:ABC transporter permease [Actinomycetota bacterium]MCI0544885.1 ABC transporter permease [Actinomycetota bacterium]MCI0678681.1 ABC transporter permease [Actinomycetota bacterium]
MATTQERVESQVLAPAGERTEKYRSLRSDVWRQFKRHKGAVAGLILMALIVLAVVVGPLVWPPDPYAIDTTVANQGPSADHPFGTDNLGRDLLARSLIGGRISLSVGFAAMLVGLILGTAVGVIAGFFRRLDGPLMRVTDLFLALPILPLLLVVVMLFREPLKQSFGEELGIFLLVVVIIGATSWMTTARVVRGDVLSIKEKEFVLAAQSIGTRKRNVIMRHIIPNTMSPVMVSAALGVAGAIITESALSFLGLGFPASFPTWGRLVFDGRNYLHLNPAWILAPGALISLTVMSVNFIGDGIRDALDPKLRSR